LSVSTSGGKPLRANTHTGERSCNSRNQLRLLLPRQNKDGFVTDQWNDSGAAQKAQSVFSPSPRRSLQLKNRNALAPDL
jgi:hypothetical protein